MQLGDAVKELTSHGWLVRAALFLLGGGGKDVLQAPALELKILFPADKDNVFIAKEVM